MYPKTVILLSLCSTLHGIACVDQCSGRPLVISGTIWPAYEYLSLFNTLQRLYTVERKKVGRKVVMDLREAVSNREFKGVLMKPSSQTNPILFGITSHNKRMDENELRFPIAAS